MKKIAFALVAVVAIVAGVLVAQQLRPKLPEYALYYQQPRVLAPFQLTDHFGEPFTNVSLRDKWSLVFLGYTSCPDICPTTLQEINFNFDAIKQLAENTQLLLVSVDPRRDTVKRLAEYISYFNDEFIAVTAGHDVLFPFVRQLGLMYALTDDAANDNYLVDHSASLLVINPAGQIVALFKPEHTPGQIAGVDGEKIVHDFARIISLY